MPTKTPGNGEEAAYISFALIDALGDLLVRKGVISRGDFFSIFETVAVSLEKSPHSSGTRTAKFVRDLRLSKE
jgi:hypothetical protein